MKPLHRVLVTGGAGFIGSHSVDLFLQEGLEVVVLDNLFTGKIENLNLRHPNLEFIEGDVLELPLLEDLLIDCDALLHLAAVASVQQTISDPIYSFQVNTQGFLHVLQAVYKAQRPIRLVYASSAAVYGNATTLPCRDDMPLAAKAPSPYALQKIHDEEYADLYANLHDVKSLALRYFNVYGPRQDPNSPYSGVVNRFLDAYKNDVPLTVYGDGHQSRDFIYVSDVARANLLALKSDYQGALNIATGEPQTLLQLISYIELAGGKPAKIHYEPERPGDIKASYGSTESAAAHLGFKYSIPLSDGIGTM